MESLCPNWKEDRASYWLNMASQTPRDELLACLELPAVGTVLSDDAAMFVAYAIALRGVGNVSPNPLVGAVSLDQQRRYLGSGAHLRVGEGHAEVLALKSLPSNTKLDGTQLFVTLEPCAHQGRTPSCAEMIARTGIERIVFGLKDPNPLVNGSGVAKLIAAGKSVEQALPWQRACEWLVRSFLHNQKFGSVFVGMKVASTLSGVIAGHETRRQWITGERARQMGRYLRLEYDAICVGARTVLLDDPMLDVRHPFVAGRAPVRVVVDGEGLLAKASGPLKILTSSPERTIVFVPSEDEAATLRKLGVTTFTLKPDYDGAFSWTEVNNLLWTQGVRSLLIEGGSGVYASAVRQSIVQALHWFVAPLDQYDGLKWPVISEAFEIYKKGGGVPLGGDRLIELSFGSGGGVLV